MIGFFKKRPGVGAFIILTFFVTGAVMAHRHSPSDKSKAPLPVATKKPRRPPPPPAGWRERMDLDKLKPEGTKLVQRLSDGTRLVTTLDPDLQGYARKLLARYELPYGAVVVSDVSSGRLLALAGHSSRDKRVDTEALTLTPWAPAASVFKLVTASALLARGVPPQASFRRFV